MVRERFSRLPDAVTKIIVTHHPFDLPLAEDKDDLVGGAALAMRAFAECRVDLLLAGHFHESHAGDTSERYRIVGHSALVVQAGTATSTRGRGETNSFNVLHIAHPRVEWTRYGWQADAGEFKPAETRRFETVGGEWQRSPT